MKLVSAIPMSLIFQETDYPTMDTSELTNNEETINFLKLVRRSFLQSVQNNLDKNVKPNKGTADTPYPHLVGKLKEKQFIISLPTIHIVSPWNSPHSRKEVEIVWVSDKMSSLPGGKLSPIGMSLIYSTLKYMSDIHPKMTSYFPEMRENQ